VSRGRWRLFGATCALAALAAACDGGTAPARGFGSRQLLPTRDPTFALNGQLDEHTLLGETMTDADGGTYSYVSIDLSTGQITDLGTSFPTLTFDAGANPFTCVLDTSSGKNVLIVTDTQSGQATRIEGVTIYPSSCPTAEDQVIFVALTDDAGIITLLTGPFDHLVRVATDLVIHQVLVGQLGSPSWTVLASPVADSGGLGLFAIDKVTFASTELIPPTLGPAAYADGAPPGGALASAGLSEAFPILTVADHFLYARVMSGGQLTAFVGPLAGGAARELALYPPQLPPTFAFVSQGLNRGRLPAFVDSHATGDVLRYWDDAQRRLVSCDLPHFTRGLAGSMTKDNRRLVFAMEPDTSGLDTGSTPTGPLLLVSLDLAPQGGACSLLAARDVAAAGFSPDDTAMFWVVRPPTGDATLLSAAVDGSAPRQLGAAASIEKAHFIDGTRLELALGADLVWLDLLQETPPLHYVAEGVFGDTFDLSNFVPGSNVLITGYQYNHQDDTGTLGLVDRETGVKRLISPSVTWYRPVTLSSAPGDTLPSLGVAYLVRGRHPSAQDGLWLATLAPGDLR
jgi:hypothetical protein